MNGGKHVENTYNYSFLEKEWPEYANLGYIIESKLIQVCSAK